MDVVRQIADAVLYEGYILWPYRKSATKNRQRWTFGGVYPKGHSEGREDDPWTMRTECLLEAGRKAQVGVGVRFLHVVRRDVEERTANGPAPVEELTVGGRRYLAWEEAVEREVESGALRVDELTAGRRLEVAIEAGRDREALLDPEGRLAGAVTRTWQPLEGEIEVGATRLADEVYRLTVTIRNTTPFAGGSRDDALQRTFCSTHTTLRTVAGRFVSLADPPPELRDAAEACRNEGTWPVLVGEPGQREALLSSPIILEDYPRIAPESPGDLFDSSEIDQMLVLNILSLTDAEKAEMRASDPRAREILERTESLSAQELMRLHGTIREFAEVRRR